MFDGFRMLTPGLVVVSGSKIQAVGADAVTPSGAELMDFGDATLSPGFIDAHTHLSMMASDDFRQSLLDGLQKPVAELALLATENLKKTLMAGVTTTRDVGSADFIDVGLRNAVRAGKIVGPRMRWRCMLSVPQAGTAILAADFGSDCLDMKPGP